MANQTLLEAERLVSALFFNPSATRASDRLVRATRPTSGPRATRSTQVLFDLFDAVARTQTGSVTPQRAFAVVGFLRRCATLRAATLSATPYTLRDDRGVVVFDSDTDGALPPSVAEVFGGAGMEATTADVEEALYLSELALALEGWCFFHKLRRRETGPVVGIEYLAPQTMSITREDYADGRLVSYTRQWQDASGSKRARIRIEDLVRLRVPDPYLEEASQPSSDGRGAASAASVLYAMDEFLGGHIGGGMLKALYFTVTDKSDTGQVPSPEQAAETKRRLTDIFFRRRKARSIKAEIFSDDLTPHEIGEGLEGLSDMELTSAERRGLAASMGVPYSLLESSAANYAVKQGDRLDLYEFLLFGEMRRIAGCLNRDLLADLGVRMRFETSRVEAVQFAENEKAEGLARQVVAGIRFPDEARAELGLVTKAEYLAENPAAAGTDGGTVGGDGQPPSSELPEIIRSGF